MPGMTTDREVPSTFRAFMDVDDALASLDESSDAVMTVIISIYHRSDELTNGIQVGDTFEVNRNTVGRRLRDDFHLDTAFCTTPTIRDDDLY